jgi:hypothetical protein
VSPLTNPRRTSHDVVVQRLISLVFAIVVALWLPVRQAGVLELQTSIPTTEGSARTEQPSQAELAPQMAVEAGTSQARLAYDVLAAQSSALRFPACFRSASVSQARIRLYISPPLRTFPLLI